jgi:hypothetical protein
MEGEMLDHLAMTMKDLASVKMQGRRPFAPPNEFWSTGNEALLEQAFAETFAEHAVRPLCEPATNGLRPCTRPGASEKDSK